MGASYGKQKNAKAGKLDVGRFTAFPHAIIHSVEYRALGYSARSLLFDIAAQYSGSNNGKLVACEKYLKPLGWNSNGTISKAIKDLVASGLLIQTRQGMKPPYSQAAWFALGWFSLDVTADLDIDPKNYRRCQPTPLTPLKQNKNSTPKNGVRTSNTTPKNGVEPSNATPKNGVVMAKNRHVPTPIYGDCIDLPSNPSASM